METFMHPINQIMAALHLFIKFHHFLRLTNICYHFLLSTYYQLFYGELPMTTIALSMGLSLSHHIFLLSNRSRQ
jgi:hypothetical protein